MPTRPIQHQLESESRVAFEALLGTWVYRQKVPDYGVDGEVEIFDQDREASGLQFLVQLKSTQEASKSPSVSLDIEWIRYYHSLELPVLLVFWVKEANKTYWRWAAEIDLYYAKPGAKTLTVSFANEWSGGTPAQLQRHIEFRRSVNSGKLRLPIGMSIDVPDRPEVEFHLQTLCSRVPGLLAYKDDAEIQCSLVDAELRINFSGHYGAVLHSMQNVSDPAIAKRAVIGVVLALDNFRLLNEAMEIWTGLSNLEDEIRSIDVAGRILTMLAKAGAYDALRVGLRNLGERFEAPSLMMPLYPLYFMAPKYRRDGLREVLIEGSEGDLEKEASPYDRSVVAYRLGRLWQDRSAKKERKYLAQAIRESKFYADKAYFWSELGAFLFNRSRFAAALRCYEYAYVTLGQTQRKCRYADSLMHVGRFGDGHRVFDEICDASSSETQDKDEAHLDAAEAQLKGYALTYINEQFGITSQTRRPQAARAAVGANPRVPADEMFANCERAIRLDALCSDAWFNRAVVLYGRGNHEEALSCFLVAAATNTSNDEAWLNVLILALERKENDLLATLFMYLTHERGIAFFRYMTENAQSRPDPRERGMLMAMAKLFTEQIPKREVALMRIHHNSGTAVIKGPARRD